MRTLSLTLRYYSPLIVLSCALYAMMKMESRPTDYLMAGILTVIWGCVSVHAWERSIIHRRLWVNQVFHPESRLYRLLKGGKALLIINVLRSLPLSLFLLLHLLQIELYEWAVLYFAFAMKVGLYHWTRAKMSGVFVSGLDGYLARVSTDYVIIGLSYVVLLYGYLCLVPHPNLTGLSIAQVMESAEQAAIYAQGSIFHQVIYYANLVDSMYLWGIQNMSGASIPDTLLRRGLVVLFAIQHFVFIVMIQRLFNGVIFTVNMKRHLTPISQLDQTQDIT